MAYLVVLTMALVWHDEEWIERTLGSSGLFCVTFAWQGITLKARLHRQVVDGSLE